MRTRSLVSRCGPQAFYAVTAVLLCMVLTGQSTAAGIRPAAVAGQFYPADPEPLKLAVEQFLKQSQSGTKENPIAIIVPHAGYFYSGQIGASGYRQVMGRNYDTIVILGVNHTTGNFRGVSLGDYSAFSTPLGNIPVDEEITSALLSECRLR